MIGKLTLSMIIEGVWPFIRLFSSQSLNKCIHSKNIFSNFGSIIKDFLVYKMKETVSSCRSLGLFRNVSGPEMQSTEHQNKKTFLPEIISQSYFLTQNTVPTHNSVILVRPKKLSLFREMSLFGVSLLWVGTVFPKVMKILFVRT